MEIRTPEESVTTPEARPIGRDGLPSLTSLRFFAAAFVVGYHLVRQVGPVTPVSMAFWYGRSGVTFFFVLSGVVLAWTYHARRVPARVFWWRRFARIWPLLFTATVLSVALYLAVGTRISAKEVVAALALVHAWFMDATIVRGGNGATWSLSDEAFFYLCFPLLLWALARSRRPVRQVAATLVGTTAALAAVWILTRTLVTSPTVRTILTDYFPPVRILQFSIGVAAGVALARGWRPRISLPMSVGLVLAYHGVMLLWGAAVPDGSLWSAYSASQLFAGPVYLLLVLAAASRDLRQESGRLASPWLVKLGHWSFALYLVHDIVIRLLAATVGLPSDLWQRAATWLVVVIASQAIAAALYTWVEHPAERHLRGLVRLSPTTTLSGSRI
ncbi:acyltransferase [Isoptericola sp. b490]|uniref:acyltransferase family protein n=1 Tax=Actinotalea lenta TaxID=3064654 RepID=UPI0027142521|nr:acyltransferase [Isoptericola sp. b490]MDO8119916.1 acyltransferase [Isoptericola sp. b490]